MNCIFAVIITLSTAFCFEQTNWQYEIIDSVSGAGAHFYFNDIDVNNSDEPYVVYDRYNFRCIVSKDGWMSSFCGAPQGR